MSRIAMVVALSALGSSAFADVTPSGLLDARHVSLGTSRMLVRDNAIVSHRTDGDEGHERTFFGGSGTSSNPGVHSLSDNHYVGFLYEDDSVVYRAGGDVGLFERGSSARVQGSAVQGFMASAEILEPVSYRVSISVTPTIREFVGDADASLVVSFSMLTFGTDGPVQVGDFVSYDLGEGGGVYESVFEGVIDPVGFTTFIRADTSLIGVIDSEGERVDVGFDMDLRFEFAPVPAPGSALVLGGLGLMGVRRRR